MYQFVNRSGFTVCPWVWVRKRFEDARDLLSSKCDVVMTMADNFADASANKIKSVNIEQPRQVTCTRGRCTAR